MYLYDPKVKSLELNEIQKQMEEMVAFAKIAGYPGFKFIESIETTTVKRTIFYEWLDKLRPSFQDETGRKNKINWWNSKHNVNYIFPDFYYWSSVPRN